MDFVNKQPIYKQICDLFCEIILRKEWRVHTEIPSVSEIAVLAEVNPNIVLRAYEYLKNHGIIYSKPDKGYFIAEQGYANTLEIRKTEFIQKDLPDIVHTIELIGLSVDDLIELLKKHRNQQ